MEQYLPWLYDILAVTLLLYYIYGASHRGFAATLANLVGYVVSWTAAWPIARYVSAELYSRFLRELLTDRVAGVLAEHPETVELAELAGSFLQAMPPYLERMISFNGYTAEELAGLLQGYASDGAQLVMDEIIGPVAQNALTTILFVLVFTVLLAVVRWVTRLLRKANRLPVIGPINSIMGGLLGVVTGAVCIYVLFLLLRLAATLTGDALLFLNTGLLDETYTWRLLNRVNLLQLF